jgi:DNA-binding CsgD family transcriptional regulator
MYFIHQNFTTGGSSVRKGEKLFEFSRAASKASNQNEVWDELKSTLKTFGVRWVNYAFGTPDELVFFSNMNPEWLDYYSKHYSASDYLVRYCSQSNHALHMDASHFNGEAQIDQNNQNMMNDIWEQGARGGICIPIPKPSDDYLAGTGIFFGLSKQDTMDEMKRTGDEIALIMLTAHLSIANHELCPGEDIYSTAHGQRLKKADVLTEREKDVLRYLTLGFRPDRIAEKMGLRIATINMHIAKARRRLGATTREQAIAIAISRRQLIL